MTPFTTDGLFKLFPPLDVLYFLAFQPTLEGNAANISPPSVPRSHDINMHRTFLSFTLDQLSTADDQLSTVPVLRDVRVRIP